jgi:hypothetical protein
MNEDLRCPITLQIFLEPVIVSDGHTYEKQVIMKVMKKMNNKSPMTRQLLTNDIQDDIEMKKLVEQHLFDHPEDKDEQYKVVEEEDDPPFTVNSYDEIEYCVDFRSDDLPDNAMIATFCDDFDGNMGKYANLLKQLNISLILFEGGFNKELDFTGYEDHIEYLDLGSSYNKAIDLSKMSNLKGININGKLINCDGFKHNRKLKEIHILNNLGCPFQLSECEDLTVLNVRGNIKGDFDLSKNVNLERLQISTKGVHSFDLSKNVKLTHLRIVNSTVHELDLTNNTQLKHLVIHGDITCLLDLSKNINLKVINLDSRVLSELDTSKNIKLECLHITSDILPDFNLSNNKQLQILYLNGKMLNCLDLSENKELWALNIIACDSIVKLDLTNNKQLQRLNIERINEDYIDISENINLVDIYLSNSESMVDYRKYPKMEHGEVWTNGTCYRYNALGN